MAPLSSLLIVWTARRAGARILRRVGWGGLILGLLMAIAATTWLLARVLADHLALREQAAVIESLQAAAQRAATRATMRNPQHDLQAFEARLPTEQERMQILSDLFALAQKQQLLLARGEYQFQRDDKAGLDNFRIILPVKGDPAAVQRFVQEALALNRALAFDALMLKREQVDSAVVEAKVQLLLFMRRGSDAMPPRPVVAGAGR